MTGVPEGPWWGAGRAHFNFGGGQGRTSILTTGGGSPATQISGGLGLIYVFTNGHPQGGFLPLPVISRQSNQLCKASDFRAYRVPLLSGKDDLHVYISLIT